MLEKRDGTTDWWAMIIWVGIIIFIVWGIYSMGKNSNKKLTPEEVREEKANCYQWYGKECDDISFNPE